MNLDQFYLEQKNSFRFIMDLKNVPETTLKKCERILTEQPDPKDRIPFMLFAIIRKLDKSILPMDLMEDFTYFVTETQNWVVYYYTIQAFKNDTKTIQELYGAHKTEATQKLLTIFQNAGFVTEKSKQVIISKIKHIQEKAAQAKRFIENPSELQVGSDTGSHYGRYHVIEKKGAGGMGIVYKVEDPIVQGRVAIAKVLLPGSNDETKMRFDREAVAMAKLEHPNILTLWDKGITKDGENFLIMRLVDGCDLKTALEKNLTTFPKTTQKYLQRLRIRGCIFEKTEFIITILRALDFAHTQGVIHRDIKPENILIDKNGIPYLSDWGCAKIQGMNESPVTNKAQHTPQTADGKTQVGFMLGTVGYMSPEQAQGLGMIDNRTDIFAMAVIAWEMFARKRLYTGKNTMAILNKMITPAMPLSNANKQIPKVISAIIEKGLSINAKDRYESAGAMADDLENFLKGEPVSVYKESFWEVSIRTMQHNKMLFSFIAVIMFLIIVSAGIFSYQQSVNAALAEKARQAESDKVALAQAELEEQLNKQESLRLYIEAQEIYDRRTDYKKVLELTNKSVELDANIKNLFLRAYAKFALGKEAMTLVLQSGSKDAQAIANAEMQLLSVIPDCEKASKLAVDQKVPNAIYLYFVGDLYQHYVKALWDLRDGTTNNPEAINKAKEYYQRAAENPNGLSDPNVASAKGMLAILAENLELAIKQLDVPENQSIWETQYQLGIVHLQLKEFTKAGDYFAKAKKLLHSLNFADACRNLSFCYVQHAESVQDFNEKIRLYEAAIRNHEQSIEIKPVNEAFTELFDYYKSIYRARKQLGDSFGQQHIWQRATNMLTHYANFAQAGYNQARQQKNQLLVLQYKSRLQCYKNLQSEMRGW